MNHIRSLALGTGLVRHYTSAARRSVLRQDRTKIPTHQYPIARPSDARVYVWGLAATGALGVQTSVKKQAQVHTDVVQHPSRLSFAENRECLDVAAGYGFSSFATACRGGKSLWGTGINTDAQIGFHKLGGQQRKPFELLIYPAPVDLASVAGNNSEVQIVRVAAGRAHQLAVGEDGTVYALGNNSYGQCGREIIKDEDYFNQATIHRIKDLGGTDDPVKEVDCGQDHSFFLTRSGRLFSCGWSDDGQTGQGRFGLVSTPGLVEGDLKNEVVTKVTGSSDTVLALNDRGEVFGWGNTEYGQLLPDGDETPQINSPRHLTFLQDCGRIVDIAAGGSYCLALNEAGDVFAWGYGILGFGPEVVHQPRPRLIPATLFGRNDFNPTSRVRAIYCGLTHSGAITDGDDLYMWGHNRHGCLGFGDRKDQFFPLKVAVSARVMKISCGVDHTLALCRAFV
ncbi:williams-Beuren syndrome chromosome region 16 protein [Culex quinquefasciatus]|uniref:Williams-Beuren syndrome chromosome region 16 protein n=2 Tax=Culex pipiens complex TaxID=518105 RepID=B0WNR4_CULQU|nr:williams-Beuren syndrome chromosome region 16 protein [Culex quinquefasciatus]|eukprot:XP_001850348.1 williams-Beuren syndrome chromosome region 16 protein [Culex quinquefasciatus]